MTLGVGGWPLEALPAELNRQAGSRAVETVAQHVGLRRFAVTDAAADADRVGDARRDVRLRLDDEEVVAADKASRPDHLRRAGRRACRRRRRGTRISHAETDAPDAQRQSHSVEAKRGGADAGEPAPAKTDP